MLLEPLPVVPAVAIFGMGHVGLELARILARHDLDLHLVDSRREQTGPERLAVLVGRRGPRARPPRSGAARAGRWRSCRRGTHVLIMTHDHAEDAALCDAALRAGQLGSIGLIGSAGKWARFRRKLAEVGHADEVIGRITTPIGLPEITGKDPATIAVSVAADLLRSAGAATGRRRSRRHRSRPDDALPGHGPRHARRTRSPAATLRAEADGALLVRDGAIVERGSFAALRPRHPTRTSSTCAAASCCPGSSTPTCTSRRSARSAGWGCRCWTGSSAARFPRRRGWPTAATPRRSARSSWPGLAQAGTTTALVFGAHFAPAVDALFTEAARVGLRVTSGLVVSDRLLRDDLLTTPERAYDEGRALARRWHGVGRNRYAVTPRFALSCSRRCSTRARRCSPTCPARG